MILNSFSEFSEIGNANFWYWGGRNGKGPFYFEWKMIKTPCLPPLFLSLETFPTVLMERVCRPFYTYQTCLCFLYVCDDYVCRGFIKGRAPGKLAGCEWDLAINLPGCFHLLFLLSFITKTKNAQLKNPTDLLHKNLMKPLCVHFPPGLKPEWKI